MKCLPLSYPVIALFVLPLSMLWGLSIVQRTGDEGSTSNNRVLPLSTCFVKGTTFRQPPASKISWKERDYEIDAGIEVLMHTILDRATDPYDRRVAMVRLRNLYTQLRGRECIQQLLNVYRTAGDREEKGGILGCVVGSEDAQGLPLLYEVVSTEKDPIVRFGAAIGLAQWNIRRGVQELIDLLPSTVAIGDRPLGAAAFDQFNHHNEVKGWGCPVAEIRAAVAHLADQGAEEYAKAWAERYRQWFEQNKDRFPDWKPGDPLPQVQQLQDDRCP